jgi:phosphorylase kinase alpha/beta subunit
LRSVRVRLGTLPQFQLTAAQTRIEDYQESYMKIAIAAPSKTRYLAHDPNTDCPLSNLEEFRIECESDPEVLYKRLRSTQNRYEQIEVLQTLTNLALIPDVPPQESPAADESPRKQPEPLGLQTPMPFGDASQPVTIADLLEEIYEDAGRQQLWSVVRRAAGLLNKLDIGLSDALTDLLVRRKQIAVGRAYSEASLISQPLSNLEIETKLKAFCRDDIRDRVLTQEILLYLGVLIKADPKLFQGFLTLRVGYLILLLTSDLAQENRSTQDDAYEALMALSPFEIKTRLRQVLAGYDSLNQVLRQQESLRIRSTAQAIDWFVLNDPTEGEAPAQGWRRMRQIDGSLNKVPKDFYKSVWDLLHHCKGIIIGDKFERRNRLDSYPLVLEMTPGETNFALQVEHLLNKIQAPEYRQVNIEALMELAALNEHNPDLQIEDYLVMDVVVGHAVRLGWLETHSEHQATYDQHKASAWSSFYESPPSHCSTQVAQAFRYLLEQETMDNDDMDSSEGVSQAALI